jgi:hypothetical protein
VVSAIVAILVATPAAAAPDEGQQAVWAQLQTGQAKLHQIEHLPVAGRAAFLREHMTLISHALASVEALQPTKGLSMKKRLAWQEEQQKLLESMVKQMLDNFHLTTEMQEK